MSKLPEHPSLQIAVKVYFYDTDAGGVVHNISYLRMIEMARSQLAESLGWSLPEMMNGDEGCPVVARTEIDYIKPAKLGDDLLVHAELVKIEKVRFYIRFQITRPSDQKLICQAQQILVSVDLKTGRPQPLRRDWRERWERLYES